MPDTKKDSPTSPRQPSNEAAVSERLEKDADEMAEAAQKVEQKYDQDHGIFTK